MQKLESRRNQFPYNQRSRLLDQNTKPNLTNKQTYIKNKQFQEMKIPKPDWLSMRVSSSRRFMRVRMWRSIDLVVCIFTNKINAKSDNRDAESRSSVAELVAQHRMLPPCIPPPEKLPSCSQWLRHNLQKIKLQPIFKSFFLRIRSKRTYNGYSEMEWGSLLDLKLGHFEEPFWAFFPKVLRAQTNGFPFFIFLTQKKNYILLRHFVFFFNIYIFF